MTSLSTEQLNVQHLLLAMPASFVGQQKAIAERLVEEVARQLPRNLTGDLSTLFVELPGSMPLDVWIRCAASAIAEAIINHPHVRRSR